MRRVLPAICILCTSKVAMADAGSAVPFELVWEAPASCPDAVFIRRRVEQIVHGPPSERDAVVAKGSVHATPDGPFKLVLRLRTGDVEETKTLTATSCSSLAQATATIIALAIDPTSDPTEADTGKFVPLPPERDPEPDASPPAATRVVEDQRGPGSQGPAPPPITSERVSPRTDTPRPWSFAPGVFASMAAGTLPEVAPGVGVSAALRVRRFRVGVSGAIALEQTATFSKTAAVSFDMLEGAAWAAYVVPVGSFIGIGPSASVEATRVRVQGLGLRAPRAASTMWPTIAAGSRIEVYVTRTISVVGRAELLVPVDAPPFSLATAEGALRLHQPNIPSVRVALGAEIVIP